MQKKNIKFLILTDNLRHLCLFQKCFFLIPYHTSELLFSSWNTEKYTYTFFLSNLTLCNVSKQLRSADQEREKKRGAHHCLSILLADSATSQYKTYLLYHIINIPRQKVPYVTMHSAEKGVSYSAIWQKWIMQLRKFGRWLGNKSADFW